MKEFRNLDVWTKAHALALEIYRVTQKMPGNENFGLTHQLRRAAVNFPTRIAEGCGRDGNVELGVELRRAKAASSELEYLILLAHDLRYMAEEEHAQLTERTVAVRKMISGLLRKL